MWNTATLPQLRSRIKIKKKKSKKLPKQFFRVIIIIIHFRLSYRRSHLCAQLFPFVKKKKKKKKRKLNNKNKNPGSNKVSSRAV
jgi:hypothetical protein